MIGRQRINRVERLWPEFGSRAIERLDVVYRSAELRGSMGRTLDRFPLSRKGRRLQVWYPASEEMERALQITGAAVRCALAQKGILDASVEDQIGMLLLKDTEAMVRLVLSRIVRPTYAKQLSCKSAGLHFDEPIVLASGAYNGWVVVGFHETESNVTGLSEIDTRVKTYSGVVFDDEVFEEDSLPFGHGDPHLWVVGPAQEVRRGPLSGPISGLQRIIDPFGPSQIFVPHPALVEAGELTIVPFDRGLTLVDKDAQAAIVCRAWRARLIGDEYFDDREHRLEGLVLLVRNDVFTKVSARASSPP